MQKKPRVATQPEGARPKCGEPAASFIPRWGMSFACVLPKGHDGQHKQGGNCFKHGEYVGEKCPQWPTCISSVVAQPAPEGTTAEQAQKWWEENGADYKADFIPHALAEFAESYAAALRGEIARLTENALPEQAAFEQWAATWFGGPGEDPIFFDPTENCYSRHAVHSAWIAWQARGEHMKISLPIEQAGEIKRLVSKLEDCQKELDEAKAEIERLTSIENEQNSNQEGEK